MRAVFLCIAGLLAVSSASAGSLLPQETNYSEQSDSKDLTLPNFLEGAQADVLTFNEIGQSGSAQLFDLGGKPPAAANGDVFRELQLDLSGAKPAPQGAAKKSE